MSRMQREGVETGVEIKDKDGNLVMDEGKMPGRWREYFEESRPHLEEKNKNSILMWVGHMGEDRLTVRLYKSELEESRIKIKSQTTGEMDRYSRMDKNWNERGIHNRQGREMCTGRDT